MMMIENTGKLRVPFTTGLLIGIGESKEDRVQSLFTIVDMCQDNGLADSEDKNEGFKSMNGRRTNKGGNAK